MEIWSKAYIDVNEVVKQNSVLRKDMNAYVLQLKTLKEKCVNLEKLRLETEKELKQADHDNQSSEAHRWVEGCSDQGSDEENIEDGEIIHSSKIVRNDNKITISCNNNYITSFSSRNQRNEEKKINARSYNIGHSLATTDDKTSCSDKQEKKDMEDEPSREQNKAFPTKETLQSSSHLPHTPTSLTSKKMTKIDIVNPIAGYKQAATKQSEGIK